MDFRWDQIIDSLPTKCARKHETVEMICYDRKQLDRSSRVRLRFFCPSCHQKLEMRARRVSDGKYATDGYEVIDPGDI